MRFLVLPLILSEASYFLLLVLALQTTNRKVVQKSLENTSGSISKQKNVKDSGDKLENNLTKDHNKEEKLLEDNAILSNSDAEEVLLLSKIF